MSSLPVADKYYFLVPQWAPDQCVTLVVVPNGPPNAFFMRAVIGPQSNRSPFQRFRALSVPIDPVGQVFAFQTDPVPTPAGPTAYTIYYYMDNSAVGVADITSSRGGFGWTLAPVGDFYAMQCSSDQNLNVDMGGPEDPNLGWILTWTWGGGQSNEVWQFIEFD